MRTYYNTDTGSFLGAYNGPDESNPYRGHPSVEGIQQRDTRMTGGYSIARAYLPREA